MITKNLAINACFIPFLCILPVFTLSACTVREMTDIASQSAQTIGTSLASFPENAKAAAPYLQEDLEKLWRNVSAGIEIAKSQVGIAEPPHELSEANKARELLIAGESIEEVARKASETLTEEDLKKIPSSDLKVLNGVLPFEIDLTTCGENLAEILNHLDIGQISAVLQSEAGYHLIKLIDRDGMKVKIGHVVFQVVPETDSSQPASVQEAELSDPMKEAVERLSKVLNNR